MKQNKTLSMLSIAAKAGKVASGGFLVEKSLQEYKAKVVLIAEDASDNTKKHFNDMCSYRSIPYMEYSDKESLGRAIGKELRATLCVTDEGLAGQIQKKMAEVAINGKE